jgi:hypothetical protein
MSQSDRNDHRDHLHLLASSSRRERSWFSGGIVIVSIAVLALVSLAGVHFLDTWHPTSSSVLAVPSPPPEASARPAPGAVPSGAPQAPVPIVASPRVNADSIYRCGNSYSRSPCADGRVVEGPAASGFDSRPSPQLARLVAEGRTPDTGPAAASTQTIATHNGGPCASLAAQIEWIDRAARQPLTKPQQDSLRAQRQAARDQQARLHC